MCFSTLSLSLFLSVAVCESRWFSTSQSSSSWIRLINSLPLFCFFLRWKSPRVACTFHVYIIRWRTQRRFTSTYMTLSGSWHSSFSFIFFSTTTKNLISLDKHRNSIKVATNFIRLAACTTNFDFAHVNRWKTMIEKKREETKTNIRATLKKRIRQTYASFISKQCKIQLSNCPIALTCVCVFSSCFNVKVHACNVMHVLYSLMTRFDSSISSFRVQDQGTKGACEILLVRSAKHPLNLWNVSFLSGCPDGRTFSYFLFLPN